RNSHSFTGFPSSQFRLARNCMGVLFVRLPLLQIRFSAESRGMATTVLPAHPATFPARFPGRTRSGVLSRGEVRRLEDVADPAGVRIIMARSGRLWVTCEGVAEDVILHAGEQWVCRNPGLVLIEALEPA